MVWGYFCLFPHFRRNDEWRKIKDIESITYSFCSLFENQTWLAGLISKVMKRLKQRLFEKKSISVLE